MRSLGGPLHPLRHVFHPCGSSRRKHHLLMAAQILVLGYRVTYSCRSNSSSCPPWRSGIYGRSSTPVGTYWVFTLFRSVYFTLFISLHDIFHFILNIHCSCSSISLSYVHFNHDRLALVNWCSVTNSDSSHHWCAFSSNTFSGLFLSSWLPDQFFLSAVTLKECKER